MSSRRDFLLAAAGAALIRSSGVRAEDPKPAFEVAVDLESFWARTPFLERLKSLSESGGKFYEFGGFKAKDVLAINKAGREADLSCARFSVFQGLTDPKRKESFVAALEDAVEVAELFGTKALVVGAGELVEKLAEDRQIDAVADALDEAVAKVKETEITLLLDPLVRAGSPKKRAFKSIKDAVDLMGEVNFDRLKLLVDFGHGWTRDEAFWNTLKEAKARIGAFRANSSLFGADGGSAGLVKRIAEIAPAEPFGYELAPKAKPEAALEALRRAIGGAKT